MKKKTYKVRYVFNGEEASRYKVVIKNLNSGDINLTVKNKTRCLALDSYSGVECKITNTGNDLYVKTEHNTFSLTFIEAEALLTALVAEALHEGKTMFAKEAYVCK